MATDPYKTLGIPPQSTDREIKDAYKKLVKKYHPDRYQDEQMKKLATEKMAEINTAYDKICDDRRRGIGAFGAANYRRQPNEQRARTQTNYRQRYEDFNRTADFAGVDYAGVRAMIYNGRLAEAESVLENVPTNSRSAEWFYLKGIICQRRGWLDNAYTYVAQATRMSGDPEYAQTLQQMNRQRGGYMTGRAKQDNMQPNGNCADCDTCDICCMSSLCCDCMDCC